MKQFITRAAFLTLLLTLPLVASASDYWIHISVDDGDEQVRVNLPIELIESVLPLIDETGFHNGHINLGRHGPGRDLDLVALMKAVRDARDGEYITVRERDEHVRVAKEGGIFIVRAQERDEDVEVRIPMQVIEALVASGNEDELDVAAAVRVLAEQGGGNFVTVEGDEERVRIWIDRSNTCD